MSSSESYPEEYKFLDVVKPLETLVLITEFSGPWYHDCGEYFQIELYGLAIDGCGRPFKCTIAINVKGNLKRRIALYSLVYEAGSLHLIHAKYYNVLDREVRFYTPQLKSVPVEYDKAAIRDWIESAAISDGLV